MKEGAAESHPLQCQLLITHQLLVEVFLLQQLHKVYPSAAVFSVASGFVHQEQLSEGMECGHWLF